MPVKDGYRTIDVIMQELGATGYKMRDTFKNLRIEPTTFNVARCIKYYSTEDVQRIKEWLQSN